MSNNKQFVSLTIEREDNLRKELENKIEKVREELKALDEKKCPK